MGSGDIALNPPASFIYDRTAKAYTATASGVGGFTYLYLGRPGTTYSNTAAPTQVGLYTVKATSADSNYQGEVVQDFAITAKGLTISGASATSRAYNGTTNVVVSGGTLDSGVESGDTVILDSSGAAGTVTSAGVGNGKAVTVTGYAISGSASGNYSLTQPTGLTVNITAKGLTISGASATSRAYNGTTNVVVSGGSLQGLESGDTNNVTLGGSPSGTVASAGVGNGKVVTVTGYTISGSASGNYSLAQPTGVTVDITKAVPTVSAAPTASGITYGLALSNSILTGGEVRGAGGSSPVSPFANNVSLTSSSVINVPMPSAALGGMTLEFWMKPASGLASGTYRLVSKNSTSGQPELAVDLNYNSTTSANVQVAVGGSVGFASGNLIQPLDWNHVAVVLGSFSVEIFVNGVSPFGSSLLMGQLSLSSQPLVFGTGFRGQLDDIRIYSGSRGATDIASDLAAPASSPFGTSLSAYYKLDEGTGTNLADATAKNGPATAFSIGWGPERSSGAGAGDLLTGLWAFDNPLSVPNAGTNLVGVTFTPSDANYSLATTNVSVVVNPASLPTVTFNPPGSLVYDRSAKTFMAIS